MSFPLVSSGTGRAAFSDFDPGNTNMDLLDGKAIPLPWAKQTRWSKTRFIVTTRAARLVLLVLVFVPGGMAATRHYYIATEEVTWDYAPSGKAGDLGVQPYPHPFRLENAAGRVRGKNRGAKKRGISFPQPCLKNPVLDKVRKTAMCEKQLRRGIRLSLAFASIGHGWTDL